MAGGAAWSSAVPYTFYDPSLPAAAQTAEPAWISNDLGADTEITVYGENFVPAAEGLACLFGAAAVPASFVASGKPPRPASFLTPARLFRVPRCVRLAPAHSWVRVVGSTLYFILYTLYSVGGSPPQASP